MNIYVSNIPYKTTESELRKAFEEFGTVDTVHLLKDKDTDRPRGIGFISMPTLKEAQRAIDALDQTDFGGRTLTVKVADNQRTAGGKNR